MTLRVHAGDPSQLLEAAFTRIERERMAGLPLLNPALRVQALDFARWRGHWLGALVTPWFLNLVLVPGSEESWSHAAGGRRVVHAFGAGDFAFVGGDEPEVGEFQTCSLVSPMAGFADQATACATARIALRMLQVEQPAAALIAAGVACPSGPATPARPAELPARPSRRTILFGASRR